MEEEKYAKCKYAKITIEITKSCHEFIQLKCKSNIKLLPRKINFKATTSRK